MTIESIFKENYASMVRIAAKYCPLYAEDIAVDAFAKFIPLYQENKIHPTKINHWLRVSAKHLAIDYNRKQAAYKNIHDIYFSQSFDNETIEPSLIQRVIESIKALPGKRGDILRMSFLDGKTIAQIAAELGGTLKTIYNLRLLACQDIARQLK